MYSIYSYSYYHWWVLTLKTLTLDINLYYRFLLGSANLAWMNYNLYKTT